MSGAPAAGPSPNLVTIVRDLDAQVSALAAIVKSLIADSNRDVLKDIKVLIEGSTSLYQEALRTSIEKTIACMGVLVKRLRADCGAHIATHTDRLNNA